MPNDGGLCASYRLRSPSGRRVDSRCAFLNTYVGDLGGENGESILPMRYTLTQLAGLTLERDVTVRVEYVTQPGDVPAS